MVVIMMMIFTVCWEPGDLLLKLLNASQCLCEKVPGVQPEVHLRPLNPYSSSCTFKGSM